MARLHAISLPSPNVPADRCECRMTCSRFRAGSNLGSYHSRFGGSPPGQSPSWTSSVYYRLPQGAWVRGETSRPTGRSVGRVGPARRPQTPGPRPDQTSASCPVTPRPLHPVTRHPRAVL